jgi:exodeoxyribonuclease VII small subunit
MKNEMQQALNRLTDIAQIIEDGETSLEETLALYKEGLKLAKKSQTVLNKYEQEILILQKDAEGLFTQSVFTEQ